MVFSSSAFLFVFLPLVLFGYYVCLRGRTLRNLFLFLASLGFYAYGEPWFVFVMIASILGNWLFALAVDRWRNWGKFILTLMLIFNLGIIFVFKYLMFTLENANYLFGAHIPVPKILLPIGISFFTFQAISYVIDVWREGEKGVRLAQKNPINVGLYISLFPQLIAGPIVRYTTIADQILNRKETCADFSEGVSRFVYGLAKKVLIANNLAMVADYAYGADHLTVATSWMAAIAYTFQIYYDFSGYSDMAIGLGKMFGFHFLENFNYPYISKSVSEFWRRWHISLGTWFRDYVYFPLGGSRVDTKMRLVFNLFVVWALTGLWHGANWTFIAWGLMYFFLISLEKLTGFEKRLGGFGHLYTMLFVVLGWVFFRAVNIEQGVEFIKTMFGFAGVPLYDDQTVFWFSEYKFFFLFALVFMFPIVPWCKEYVGRKGFVKESFYTAMKCFLLVTSVAYIVKGSYNPFIYFNF